MALPVERWFAAIPARVSTRTFSREDIPREHGERLQAAADSLTEMMPGARAVIVAERADRVLRGSVGPYGLITGAPAYAVFIGDTSRREVNEAIGYLGEGVILEATSLGLATCWVGGMFRPEAVRRVVRMAPGEKAFAMSPLGYAPARPGWRDRVIRTLARSHKRKNLEELCPSLPLDAIPAWARSGLEAARLAPSARNRQPWRFCVRGDEVVLFTDTERDTPLLSKRLDCGIALLHFELGARHAGWEGRWHLLGHPRVAAFIRASRRLPSTDS